MRGIKQAIWKDAMSASDEVRIKYASKYAGSSNYWKNSIGMNRGLANLNVIERKKEERSCFLPLGPVRHLNVKLNTAKC